MSNKDLEENTKALQENTKALQESNNLAKKFVITWIF